MAGPIRSRRQGLNRPILGLAIPALGALAIDPLLTLADTAFVARLGTIELAALGVDTAILGFAFFGFNFLAYVTTPLVAKALGRDDEEGAKRWVGDAVVLAIGLGILAAVGLLIGAGLFIDLMGASATVAGPAVDYLMIRALATPAVLVVTAGHGAFRGYHDTKTPLLVAALVNGVNLVLDPLFIFGFDWGLQGAAIATVLAQWLGAAFFIRLLVSRSMISRPRGFRSAIPTLMTLGKNGVLVSMRTAALLVAFTVAASKATRLGAEEIAAHQVVAQVWLLAAMIADAFAIAGQVMVGEGVGKSDGDQIDSVSARLMAWGVAVGLGLFAVFWATRGLLDRMTVDPRVGELAVEAGGVAALMQPLAAPLFVVDGIFLGLLALGVLVGSTATGSAVAVGLILFSPLGETLSGIWWALAAMVVARLLVFAFSYRSSVKGALRS